MEERGIHVIAGRRQRTQPWFGHIARYVLQFAAICAAATGIFAAGYDTGAHHAQANGAVIPASAQKVAPLFWQAWHIVEHHYVNVNALVPQKMIYGAISGMVNALGDTDHTRFLTPSEVKQEHALLSGHFVGIGIRVAIKNGRPVIVAPLPHSPAAKAGLLPGDIILAVNGKSTAQQDFNTIGAEIRGPQGTQVTLTIQRPSPLQTFNVTITREPITAPALDDHIFEAHGKKLIDIHLLDFSAGANQQLRVTLEKAEQHHVNGVILDLRDNPGGLLDEAIKVSSEFLSSGTVLIEQQRNNKRIIDSVVPGGIATKIPLAVLVNNGTASAAEITAGALKDHHRAPIIGVTTFGTGTVLTSYRLSDGSQILLGTEEWLTPNGTSLWHHGVTPTITVPLPTGVLPLYPSDEATMTSEQILHTKDLQLRRAIEVLTQSGALNP